MEVGAIVSIPSNTSTESARSRGFAWRMRRRNGATSSHIATWDILGMNTVARMMARLRKFGISAISLIHETANSETTDNFWTSWDQIVAHYINQGVETILLVRMGSYAELDFNDLLHFHLESRSSLTQVYDADGPLDMVCVTANELRDSSCSFRGRLRSLLPGHRHYLFAGYSNRLKNVADFRRLAQDALCGRNAIRPLGKEADVGVWIDESARIDDSCRVVGPAYIGKNVRLQAKTMVSGASAVEQGCRIDYGTKVNDSCVLPYTYLGMGLTLNGMVASQGRLWHLGRNVELEFHDRRLLGDLPLGRRLLSDTYSLLLGQPTSERVTGQPDRQGWHL